MTLTEAFNLYNNSNYFSKSNVALIVTIILALIILFLSITFITSNKKKEKEGKQNSLIFRNEIILTTLIFLLVFVSMPFMISEQMTNVLNDMKNKRSAFNQFYLRYHQSELSAERQQLLKEASKQFYELNIEEKEIKNENKTCYSWNLNKEIPTETHCLSNKNSETNKETRDEFEKFIIMRYLFNEKHHPKWNEH